MKHRGPLAVFFLTLFTFGIYGLVWHVKTKGELNRLGANIPTSWLLIVPFANLYWLWKYSEGVELVTGGKISAVMAIILLLLLSIVGIAILQSMYNGLGDFQAAPASPAPAAPISPMPSLPNLPTSQPVVTPLPSTPLASPQVEPMPSPASVPPQSVVTPTPALPVSPPTETINQAPMPPQPPAARPAV